MSNIQMKIIRSDGRVLETRPGGWTVEESKLENWDYFEQEITTAANVLTDGSSLVGKRLGEIDRTAYLAYLGNDKTLLEQQTEAKTFFNPKFTFQVYMTYNGRTRWVEGELDAFQCVLYKGMMVTEITFTILCLDPYWRDADGSENSLTDAKPMFGFPFVSIYNPNPGAERKIRGFVSSVLIFDGENTITNDGDVPCKYTVRIEFSGNVVNPYFEKNGRRVTLIDTMQDGDVVEIDFQASPPTVTKNGTNCIQKASRDSHFTGMELEVGENIVKYGNENEANAFMNVKVLHNKRYLGV